MVGWPDTHEKPSFVTQLHNTFQILCFWQAFGIYKNLIKKSHWMKYAKCCKKQDIFLGVRKTATKKKKKKVLSVYDKGARKFFFFFSSLSFPPSLPSFLPFALCENICVLFLLLPTYPQLMQFHCRFKALNLADHYTLAPGRGHHKSPYA